MAEYISAQEDAKRERVSAVISTLFDRKSKLFSAVSQEMKNFPNTT